MSEVAVIGAGVAGIQAALDIANHGIKVHLIEKEPTIGGHMSQLDKTFPTNDCSMCILSPKMVDAQRNPNIILHTLTEVKEVKGEVGNFEVKLLRHPRYVDEYTCTGCGDCMDVCPVEVYNHYEAGIGVRKAIYKPHPQVIPNVAIRDTEHCIDCGLCYDVCGPVAVLHDDEDKEEEFTINVASIVVATGFETFNPERKKALNYLRTPNVITSLEFERMICASGPTGGSLKRLSNGEKPKSIVFLQCVGSRDMTIKKTYCSCVCCMYAIKNAILLKEKDPKLDITLLYMDIRAYGKGYEEYYERANQLGINFIRGIPGEIIEDSQSNLEITVENTENGEIIKLKPELVILSVGMEPAKNTAAFANILGIETDDTGFFRSENMKMNPVGTIKPGIYIAGAAVAPKDIPDSVIQGGAAAMKAVSDALKSN
ncbi:CoB--CoM heterodisulfide reductase iron-sulfur subunit A family protein [Methanoplanus sp. FWC-SCC4]|uniref:CoB--CoM heterodisulfide reductase iron-sulfur subunit A n=1 Tax=Methanochimaera problematica TaxID=2609417 RepID=A0AA97FBJ9_9EURY|nr:CoB--CoM heterodisulfide reductase iron-sulfur subunit A family protein [Methanoplanus sp. FWC-SCC4]WOF16420.1 CoB--CoM heterodisulfide reductase iron-sulfur subunit A family protein [Methanoplanus sp. FWC-SCC4]